MLYNIYDNVCDKNRIKYETACFHNEQLHLSKLFSSSKFYILFNLSHIMI